MSDDTVSSKAGYKYLESYRLATVIYDLTVEFCRLFLDPRSRTTDQMTQAGRSGKQNITEGYLERSLKSYIKLLGVALASLGELLEDYEDFLRQRGLLMITLCQRAIFLLGRQIQSLEQKFIREGGYTENLFKKRLAQRSSQ